MDSDWEEPGERSWDTMRALDYLLSWADVDPGRIILSGLSLSGEVTADTAGLDPRLFMSIPAGYSPDQSVMLYNGSHPCWQWQHADIREYVDISDYFALNVPRPLLIETGKQDYTFSWRNPPFSSDKQVARRNLASYSAEATQFNLYLHYDQHHYHVGDINPTSATEQGVSVPDELEPLQPWDQTWQVSGSTHRIQPTLFAAIASAAMIPPPDFSLAVSPAAPTVTAAQSTSFLLTVTPAGGFNDSLSLSCTNVPPGPRVLPYRPISSRMASIPPPLRLPSRRRLPRFPSSIRRDRRLSSFRFSPTHSRSFPFSLPAFCWLQEQVFAVVVTCGSAPGSCWLGSAS